MREVGFQVLWASNWRPDCAEAVPINVDRLLPPITARYRRILFGPPEANTWMPHDEVYEYGDRPADENNTIRIEVMART